RSLARVVGKEGYVQRASAGLIVTECTQVSDQAHGIIRAPGLHRADQITAWRGITDAVHAAGGRIYCQIWHCGRVAHPDMRGGEMPVGRQLSRPPEISSCQPAASTFRCRVSWAL